MSTRSSVSILDYYAFLGVRNIDQSNVTHFLPQKIKMQVTNAMDTGTLDAKTIKSLLINTVSRLVSRFRTWSLCLYRF